MATTTLRVHKIAKELGVPSKMIIAKCAAEGIELKNHMAAISVGLAESIREWFSVGADVTSVEVAQKVDVEQIRRTDKKKKKTVTDIASPSPTVTEEPTTPASTETAVAVIESPPAPPAEVETPTPVAEPEPEVPAVEKKVAAAPTEAPPAPAEDDVEEPPAPESAAPDTAQPAEPEEPSEPIVPAGPQVVPKPAELQGPRVVRVEAPETPRYNRPRPAPAARARPGADSGPAMPEPGAPTAPRRGRGKGRRAEEESAARARAKSPRRHGTSPSEVDARVREWRDQDLLERKERLASVTGHGLRDRRAAERRRQATTQTPGGASARKDTVSITTPIMLKEFCSAVGTPFMVVSKRLIEHTGQLWSINQSIDSEQAELLAMDLGITLKIEQAKTAYERLQDEFAGRERKNLKPRPPVVAMLGHVDHGKTSLLDAIRKANVAAGEAGGITQHIGAYRITRGDWDVTFVDTPGHEAFTAMRARGANMTDVVVLVVAADDGVMPQTAEAINHAKAAGVAIVVALNKIDLAGVDLNRVYADLATHELAPADWGGTTDLIKTSATTGQGVDELIAHLSTLSELMELKADPTVPAEGVVIESQMSEGHGVVAQVLVREGTLRTGRTIVCGPGCGRIRALRDDHGKSIREAGPGTPVEVSGLDALPESGDRLYEVSNLAVAKQIAEEVRNVRRSAELASAAAPKPRTLEALMQSGVDAEVPELNVILRADVQGSVEVLKKSLEQFPADKAKLTILQSAVGAVSEADVHLAKASGALIIGFHVVAEDRARQLADQLGVEIRQYRVIYEILDDLQKALAGLLAPEEKEESRGVAEVRQVFSVSRVGKIAGCYVTDGVINRNCQVRVVRDGRIVLEKGQMGSLRRFKDDAKEVRAGFECGIKIEGFDDLKPGDLLHAYEIVEVAQVL